MLIAALFLIAPNRKQPKCFSTGEQQTSCIICIMDYYAAIKKNGLLIQDRSQVKKASLRLRIVRFHLYNILEITKEMENRFVIARVRKRKGEWMGLGESLLVTGWLCILILVVVT